MTPVYGGSDGGPCSKVMCCCTLPAKPANYVLHMNISRQRQYFFNMVFHLYRHRHWEDQQMSAWPCILLFIIGDIRHKGSGNPGLCGNIITGFFDIIKVSLFLYFMFCLLLLFVAVSCGEPSDVPNSIRTGTSFTFGSSVHYQCNTGYYISGSSDRMCQSSGTWSGQAPLCNGRTVKCILCFIFVFFFL